MKTLFWSEILGMDRKADPLPTPTELATIAAGLLAARVHEGVVLSQAMHLWERSRDFIEHKRQNITAIAEELASYPQYQAGQKFPMDYEGVRSYLEMSDRELSPLLRRYLRVEDLGPFKKKLWTEQSFSIFYASFNRWRRNEISETRRAAAKSRKK